MLSLGEALNIKIQTTGAESPWSNGIVERHNLVLSEMLNKVLEEQHCNFEVALAWCLNAKNSLQNVHGFSPFQLAIGQNPSLPCAFSDKLPALSKVDHSNIIRQHLNTLHKAREAFVMNENSEKIRRALRHNVRTSNDNIYVTGDSVYYKRACDRRWRGPAVVLGKDGQQVLVKHGGKYLRCHPCRLALEHHVDHQQKSVSHTEDHLNSEEKNSTIRPNRITRSSANETSDSDDEEVINRSRTSDSEEQEDDYDQSTDTSENETEGNDLQPIYKNSETPEQPIINK